LLDRIKKLFSPDAAPEVEYEQHPDEGEADDERR